MVVRTLEPTPLHEAVALLPDGLRDTILCVEAPLGLATPDCNVLAILLHDDDLEAELEEWVPDGYDYMLEADTAAEAAGLIGPGARMYSGTREQAAAIVYYAIFDAFLPVGDGARPMGGNATWGSSAVAAAEANLQPASEIRARFPDRVVPSTREQWSVSAGDVVDLSVWFASPGGPRAETRPVRIDRIDGDLIEGSAVGAGVELRFRHDHIVAVHSTYPSTWCG